MDERGIARTNGPRDGGNRTFLTGESSHINEEPRQRLATARVPVLLHANNPHECLFVAALDGTGNDFIHDPEHATNVGLIYEKIKANTNDRIKVGYVEGPGTQQNPVIRIIDGAGGYTVEERAEQMYKKFIDQAGQWKQEDPDAQIRVASVGFSRGCEEVALFARLVHERGIQDPAGAHYAYDSGGQIKHVEYTQPALVGPGKVAQAVALFDPVGTGEAMDMDRRLPPSVVSGLQLNAMDEYRRLFKSDRIIDPGITPDGRFIGLDLVGSHSDIGGGGYLLNGLSIRAGNMAVDYLNALSDEPYLERVLEPDDPRLNVIHRSEDGSLLYGIDYKVDRSKPEGFNELLVGRHMAGRVVDAYNAEPRDENLSAQFEWQHVPVGSQGVSLGASRQVTQSDLDQLIDRLYQGALHHDAKAMDAAASDYLRTPQGQAWEQQILHYGPALQPVPWPVVPYQAMQQESAHHVLVMQHP